MQGHAIRITSYSDQVSQRVLVFINLQLLLSKIVYFKESYQSNLLTAIISHSLHFLAILHRRRRLICIVKQCHLQIGSRLHDGQESPCLPGWECSAGANIEVSLAQKLHILVKSVKAWLD